jgi:hypothetical protein
MTDCDANDYCIIDDAPTQPSTTTSPLSLVADNASSPSSSFDPHATTHHNHRWSFNSLNSTNKSSGVQTNEPPSNDCQQRYNLTKRVLDCTAPAEADALSLHCTPFIHNRRNAQMSSSSGFSTHNRDISFVSPTSGFQNSHSPVKVWQIAKHYRGRDDGAAQNKLTRHYNDEPSPVGCAFNNFIHLDAPIKEKGQYAIDSMNHGKFLEEDEPSTKKSKYSQQQPQQDKDVGSSDKIGDKRVFTGGEPNRSGQTEGGCYRWKSMLDVNEPVSQSIKEATESMTPEAKKKITNETMRERTGNEEVFSEVIHGGGLEGWLKKGFKRQSGETVQRVDYYWYSPKEKYRLRSMMEVKRFTLALQAYNGDEKSAKMHMNNFGPPVRSFKHKNKASKTEARSVSKSSAFVQKLVQEFPAPRRSEDFSVDTVEKLLDLDSDQCHLILNFLDLTGEEFQSLAQVLSHSRNRNDLLFFETCKWHLGISSLWCYEIYFFHRTFPRCPSTINVARCVEIARLAAIIRAELGESWFTFGSTFPLPRWQIYVRQKVSECLLRQQQITPPANQPQLPDSSIDVQETRNHSTETRTSIVVFADGADIARQPI